MTARTFTFTKTTPYYRRHRALPVLVSSDELTPEKIALLVEMAYMNDRDVCNNTQIIDARKLVA